jgi:hypothetical protein
MDDCFKKLETCLNLTCLETPMMHGENPILSLGCSYQTRLVSLSSLQRSLPALHSPSPHFQTLQVVFRDDLIQMSYLPHDPEKC